MKTKQLDKEMKRLAVGKKICGMVAIFFCSLIFTNVGFAAQKVEVKTEEELSKALKNPNITEVEVINSITLKKDINKIPNRNVIINGGADKNIVINMGKKTITGETNKYSNSQLKIENANIIADQVTGRFFSQGIGSTCVGWDILSENVTYKGARFVHLSEGKLTFSGNNDIQTRAENAWVRHLEFLPNSVYHGEAAMKDHGQFSAFYFNGSLQKGKAVGTVKIGEQADVKIGIGSQSNVNHYYPAFYDKVYKVDVAENSKLEINAAGVAFQFIPRADYFVEKKSHIGTGSPIFNIGKNSKVHLNGRGGGNYATMKLQYYGTEVNIDNGAELVVSGKSSKGVVESEYKGASFNINEPENVEFENKLPGSKLFYSTKTKIAGKNISEIKYWGQTGGDYQERPLGTFNANENLLIDFGKCCDSKTLQVKASDTQTQKELNLENYGKISLKGQVGNLPGEDELIDYIVYISNDILHVVYKEASTLEIYENGVLIETIDVVYSNIEKNISFNISVSPGSVITVKGYHNGKLVGEGQNK